MPRVPPLTKPSLRAPFPYFGGKSTVAAIVWERFGDVKHYIEPFCGSAAMLLASPQLAPLEVVSDSNFYIANFWRAVQHQPDAVWRWSDYPVSHIDLYARHRWLTQPRVRAGLGKKLANADWPGDAKVAGWWVWGQCCWIGSGWCEREVRGDGSTEAMQIPHASDAGRGLQANGLGKIPHAGSAGRGLQANGLGKIPHASDAGRGLQANGLGQIPHASDAGRGDLLSPHRAGARDWLHRLAARLERVRVVHGAWDRCLNNHYGGNKTAVFLDPPYLAFEKLYAGGSNEPVARSVEAWAKAHPELRIALCGHRGDYKLPGWTRVDWSRSRNTYGSAKTKDSEAIWFSPACEQIRVRRAA